MESRRSARPSRDGHAGAGQLFQVEAKVDEFAPRRRCRSERCAVADRLSVDEIGSMRLRRISEIHGLIASSSPRTRRPSGSLPCNRRSPWAYTIPLGQVDHPRQLIEARCCLDYAPPPVFGESAKALGAATFRISR